MSFAVNHDLTRSSVFKILLLLVLAIGILYSLFVHQVFLHSERFHRDQLNQQLQDELQEFGDANLRGGNEIERLVTRKRESDSPFTYNIIRVSIPQSYPVMRNSVGDNQLILFDGRTLEIGIKPELLKSYRSKVVPMILSGVLIPVTFMFIGVAGFAIVVLRKLHRVNHAMNRFLCGEKKVKLPVSANDDEFDILAIHLNFMIEQMEKNEETLKSLSIGMAHDMRTPMARLKLRLEELTLSENLDESHAQELMSCQDELDLILSLFNSMLEIARLNSGQVAIKKEVVNLGQVTRDVVDFLMPLAEQKNQTLTLREDEPCQIQGDRSLMFRALFNLVENAVKYTPESGCIEVVTDQCGVVVSDNGIGISDTDKNKVCQPLFRADKSRSETGNGIGLALVEAVVKQHQAKLIFKDNQPGLRARIFFS
ncbi:putative Signal transduction histidine kinase [Vibrio nigripulchritudo MADA3029]|uniref:histidine kinase n=2 Tax=Vibrio nigripulchritudo TaxID=28173 RepID=U4K3H0_9VIBR|nr:HAMP domain-containing sensor histidine kinase [Vibrio nigripulchritudo]EGU61212.1 Two component system histidine kinase [Vibrio nigripulchritudo ATCC 27043]KJY80663.1 ATPase [Vibrio nigripulchritudo]CCN34101.1 putative Signal transduction histidine kinase [Vibrio nigripulchritudo AM115]CCN40471.1 putative Signal transduction histidine kinase [Vibrio nigripulchritudo FTn2]CCN49308.1 putative Signal transduction histidine kinase [Vibrio nigripulchritudo MADA3020]